MARTVEEIKNSMTEKFVAEPAIVAKYGLDVNKTFEEQFSKVSIESIMFHNVAFNTFVLESLFDIYRAEVEARIADIVPHRAKWYCMKSLAFMKDKTLIADTDEYDTAAMEDEEIAAAKVVKHAVAVESKDASLLTIKIAGEAVSGEREPLDADTETQFAAYIKEIKDAGVRISIVNVAADKFNCEIDIYYDAVLLPGNVELACRKAIERYVENLPFNGEYSNMSLIDSIQQVEGVKIAELKAASYISAGNLAEQINAKVVPLAGYFKINDVVLNMIAH